LSLEGDIGRHALRLLTSREHSRRELRGKLRARGFDETDIERLLDELGDRDLLSEKRMVEAYVAERVRKGFGPVRIRQELRRRGLADDLIEPYLARSTQEWHDLMSAAHEKKFGPARPDGAKERAWRARFLEYRGFPAELIAGFLHGDERADTEFFP